MPDFVPISDSEPRRGGGGHEVDAIWRPSAERRIRSSRIGDHLLPSHVPKLHVAAEIAETRQSQNVALIGGGGGRK